MSEITLQSIFDQVLVHAGAQKKRSVDHKLPRYRGPRDLKCFTGILISDEEYEDNIEGKAFSSVIMNLSLKRYYPFKEELNEIQNIHDFFSPYQWEKEFKKFAKKYNLNYSKPEK